jgi:transcriptional regulator with XRE-family HTH domain
MYRPFKKLRLRMVEMDYNQKDLARAAGIVPSTFSLRIRGKQPFNSAQIAAIARVLNIPTSEIGAYFFEEPARTKKAG